jgi:hypothetical protein
MYSKSFIFAIVAVLVVSNYSDAAPRRKNYTYSTPNYSSSIPSEEKVYSYTNSVPNSQGNSDQERCQAEANYMAANNITGHVWSCIGSFEGVGYGSSPNCNTCTPSGRMSLTGDASAQGKNGRWYRVRSWR